MRQAIAMRHVKLRMAAKEAKAMQLRLERASARRYANTRSLVDLCVALGHHMITTLI